MSQSKLEIKYKIKISNIIIFFVAFSDYNIKVMLPLKKYPESVTIKENDARRFKNNNNN